MTFEDKFECGHVERTQVGSTRDPVIRDNDAGTLCFWCDERRKAQEAADQWLGSQTKR